MGSSARAPCCCTRPMATGLRRWGAAPKTIRAMLEEHRKNPTCNMCHGVIEPNGLPLERFTVTGQWRDIDWQANAPIDSKVTMPDGSVVEGPADLRRSLLSRPGQFVQ